MLRIIARLVLFWSLTEAIYHLELDQENTIFWDLDYAKQEFVAEVHSHGVDPHGGWVGIGFSDYGSLTDGSGDFCIVWKSHLSPNNGRLDLTDVHIKNATNLIQLDPQQDCQNFDYVWQNGTLKWTFKRKFVTCDLNDYAIEEGTTHLHWIRGNGPLFDIKGVSISKASTLGMVRVRFLKNLMPDPILDPTTTFTFDVLTAKVKVPALETTYWCHIVKLPERLRKKHQIVQFAVNVQTGNEALVHHMEVFHCEASPSTDIPMYAGPCDNSPKELSVCSRVMAAWAMGAEPLHYPEEVGYPIGGPDFNPYVRLEIHYNNPEKKADWVDSSGMKFWITEKFREYDAGVIELGLEYTDKDSIPPGQAGFTLTGTCNRECTSVGIPPGGITVFASQLHTHLTGTRVLTRHFRKIGPGKSGQGLGEGLGLEAKELLALTELNGGPIDLEASVSGSEEPDGWVELPMLNWDNHHSTHFQEIRKLKRPVKVLPGDVLLTNCEYKTMDRPNMTLGGFAISDEMCVNYIHYYPRSNLEVCKSSVSWKHLREYFHFLSRMDGQKIDPEGPVSSDYTGIEWTPFRAKLLADFYNKSPVDMQCNQSDGTRFPGTWDSMPKPQFSPLPPKVNPNLECSGVSDDGDAEG